MNNIFNHNFLLSLLFFRYSTIKLIFNNIANQLLNGYLIQFEPLRVFEYKKLTKGILMSEKLGFRENMTEVEIVGLYRKDNDVQKFWGDLDIKRKKRIHQIV